VSVWSARKSYPRSNEDKNAEARSGDKACDERSVMCVHKLAPGQRRCCGTHLEALETVRDVDRSRSSNTT
jgi:hypothetical protein